MLLVVAVLLGCAASVFAHGGKTHAESFTAFEAFKQATELYDRLIVSGKLDETWETGFSNAEVISRDSHGQKEYRVRFQRQTGDPEAVYIFFSAEGQYTGSNFDGQW
jgi:hypothetical protein